MKPLVVSHPRRRKLFQTFSLVALASGVISACLPSSARAATEYWDPTGTSTLGGNGIWDAGTTANWSASTSGGSPIVWTNGNDADFRGGSTYTVTVNGTVAANSILNTADNNTVVTFAGMNAGTLQLGAGGLNVQNGASGVTFSSTLALQFTASQIWQPGNNGGILVNSNITEAGGGGYTLTEQSSGFGGKQITLAGTNTFTNFTMNDTGGSFLSTPNYQLIISANSTTLTGNLNLQAGSQGSATSQYDAIVIGNSATPATLSANTVTKTGSGFTQVQIGQAGNFIVGAGGGTSTVASPIVDQSSTAANQTGTLTKAGAGTLTLTGNNTFHGSTVVNGGTLALGVANTLANTSGITVNAGALSLTAANALATPGATTGTSGNPVSVAGQVPITLGGGTLLRNGTGVSLGSQSGTSGTVGVGLLTLTAASTLDFGTAGVGTLNFNSFSDSGNFVLTVTNYTHTTSGAGVDGTDDRLIFNQNMSGLLSDFSINGQTPTQVALGNGEYELTVAPVPEPSTWMAGVMALGALGWRARRRLVGPFVRRGAAV